MTQNKSQKYQTFDKKKDNKAILTLFDIQLYDYLYSPNQKEIENLDKKYVRNFLQTEIDLE